MSIIAGWLDWSERIAGVPDKVYSKQNEGLGIACHSIEGYMGSADVPARFLSTEKYANGTTLTSFSDGSVSVKIVFDIPAEETLCTYTIKQAHD